jgi:hypothetical protein
MLLRPVAWALGGTGASNVHPIPSWLKCFDDPLTPSCLCAREEPFEIGSRDGTQFKLNPNGILNSGKIC